MIRIFGYNEFVNKHPKVKLIEDIKKDAQLGVAFVKMHYKGSARKHLQRFLPDELLDVLKKGMPAKVRDKRVRSFTLRRHRTDHSRISKGVADVRKDWKRVEGRYFRLVDRIFNKHPWPPGKYAGYATIFWSYPRNINEKTFYFPYRHRKPHYANKVIAHEMLHFMFFYYTEKKFGIDKLARKKDGFYGHIWKVSEAFNCAIEDWAPYKKVFLYGASPHPGTEEMAKKMSRQWNRQMDVDKLLGKWLKN